MKFIANHTLVIGKGSSSKTLTAGDTLPNLPLDELLRLKDLDAITGVGEDSDEDLLQQSAVRKAAADKAAADKAAAEKAAADKSAAAKAAADKAAAEKAAAERADAEKAAADKAVAEKAAADQANAAGRPSGSEG